MATQQWKYHVFISFRGEDTRLNFVCHLNDALRRTGLNTFVDNQLRRGEEINTALLQAIHDSKVSIIIFSENYASSSWCLDELLKIIECHETHNQIVIPVFYRVNPSDVRKQNGRFEESFARHSENHRYSNKIQKWKDALTQAANISGMGPDANREDNKLIDQTVRVVSEELKHPYHCSLEGFPGLESKISQVKALLATGSSDVRMVGIWGMGGIGKTTLAEAIFAEVSSQFEGRCFIRNVREVSEKKGILKLLQKLISELLEERDLKMDTEAIKPALLERLKSKRVFVVFDDVGDLLQLRDLTGNQSWFGAGSNIIITSRDKHVFEGIKGINIHEVEALSGTESYQLFVRNAQPSEDNIPLIDEFLNYAKGNPLAIKVLGSFLCGREVKIWRDELKELSNCPNEKIQNVLKLSYEGLNRQQKAIFLDIACFFKGENIDEAKRVFSSCELSADVGVSVLVDKSLVTLRYNKLDMHDLLQEMGREIVRQESNDPRGRSRLWDAEEIRRVFEENEGNEAIEVESIILNTSQIRDILVLDPNVFERMRNLKVLRFYTSRDKRSKLHLTERLRFLPSGLRYLHWDGYSFESLPSGFRAKELRVLDLPGSEIKQIWEEVKATGKLKAAVQFLIDIVFGKLPFGIGNIEVPSSSRQSCSKLTSLDMSYCKNLKSFPINVDLQCLEILDLRDCSNLKIFPEISTNLRKLYMRGTAIKEVHSSSIEGLSRLQELHMQGCQNLKSFPNNVDLQGLEILNLKGCSNLKIFPEISTNLRKLDVGGTAIKEVHSSSIEGLSRLQNLDMEGCQNLQSFPNNVDLECLEILNLKECSNLKIFPEISTNLRKLYLWGTAIKEVHSSSIEGLSRLQELDMAFCKKLESLPSNICKLQALQELNLYSCSSLKKFPEILEPMYNLRKVELTSSGIEALPSSIDNLEGLESLKLSNCLNLASFPDSFGNIVRRIREFFFLGALTHNSLDCEDLKCLRLRIFNKVWPNRIDRFDTTVIINRKDFNVSPKDVMKFDVSERIFYLIDLPSHPSLRFFSPKYILDLSCCSIRELPKNLGSLYYLSEIDLSGNDFEEIPASVKQLSLLESLGLGGCPKLRSLPQLPASLCELTAVSCKSLKTLLTFQQPIFNGCQIKFNVNRCFKLEEKECEAMAYKLLLTNGPPKNVELRYSGSRISKWFKHQTTGDIIKIKLPSNWLSNCRFFGFAFCVVLDCPDIGFTELVTFECDFEDKYSPDIMFSYKSHFAPFLDPLMYVPPMQFVRVWCVHDFNIWISKRRQLFRLHCINMASFKFSHWEGCKIKECGITPLYMKVDEGYVQGVDDEQDDADENAYWMLESLLLRKMSTKDMNSEDTDNDMIPEDDEDEFFETKDKLSEANDELSETASSSD